MYGYVYKTTNLINGKIYVGQKKSDKFVPTYFGSGALIKNALKKYGRDNFKVEVIETTSSRHDLDEKEKYWIEKLESRWQFGNYNIARGGLTSGYDINDLPEWRQKEIKEKLSKAGKGRKHTLETRRKMSKTRTGMKVKRVAPGNRLGAILTEEHKRKLSEAKKGRKLPEEQKRKMSESHKKLVKGKEKEYGERFKGYYDNRKRAVDVYKDGILILSFPSVKTCTKYFSDRGLGKRPVVANLNHDIPICPEEKPKKMSPKLYETRLKYKDYKFIYSEGDKK